ncbi:MAG: polysaccharide biosynthesis/export family protein [Bacteroidales bacterium]|nr:polysaccharide biosynthesis/export family protein [Bacteroidales bacterium]
MNRNRLQLSLILACFLCLLAVSCGTVEEYVLINDVATPHQYRAPNRVDLTIKRGDDLQILVAHHVPKLVENFNKWVSSEGNGNEINTYRVNSRGNISYPIFDSIYVLGMTCRELERYLERRMTEEGLVNSPTVHVKIKNFKVTVIGDNQTGVFEFDEENVTIFDLLAKANLLSGNNRTRRDKVLIIRDCDSTLMTDYLSLLSMDIIYSPYYFLQQNDIVYVYPSKSTIRRSNDLFDYWWARLSIITTAVSVGTLVLSLFNQKKS